MDFDEENQHMPYLLFSLLAQSAIGFTLQDHNV